MPRLTADQVRAAILHDDVAVRQAAVHYFSDARSPDPSVMPVVIQALERFGRSGALRFNHLMIGLAQTEETVRWAFDELTAPGRDFDYLSVICRLLCEADPRLIAPHENGALARHGFFPAYRDRMLRRVHYLARGSEELWLELEAICEEGKDRPYAGALRWDDAGDAVTALALRGPACADRAMASLAEQATVSEGHPAVLMQPLMARLAGELRHEPAVPLLVKLLHEDGELLNEECLYALARIGTDAVVRAIREQYPAGSNHFRNYAIGALERTHTDLCVSACIDLLRAEEDPDLRGFLAGALVGHFSTEGNEVAREALLADPDQSDLRDGLIVACALTGQDFPELPAWRREAEAEARDRERWVREMQSPRPSSARAPASARAIAAEPRPPAAVKVGRNDPCPCGSGKKFKKCCLAKEEEA